MYTPVYKKNQEDIGFAGFCQVGDAASAGAKEKAARMGGAPASPPAEAPLWLRTSSAASYAFSSFAIMAVNKEVLTVKKFPSFLVLGVCQMLVTIITLGILRFVGYVQFPALDRSIPRKIWPLPVVYLGNQVTGLGGTKMLSLPMLTALRRFSILMTMGLEFYLLGVRPELAVQLSVYGMVLGAIVAACADPSFDLMGYTMVFTNDLFTAANGVYSKQKLEARDLGKNGLAFYNALFMIAPLSLVAWWLGHWNLVYEFAGWSDGRFQFHFLTSCAMGTVLMYTTMLCTQHNSALVTTVIGCIKNIAITYYGMWFNSDFQGGPLVVVGLHISIFASCWFAYLKFKSKPSATLPVAVHQNGNRVVTA
ncbi:UDP-sugar transporter sqv-7-like isoform X2 [Amphibalanus amphitrite]|uniref:UDP-sugar transporter sqv-7-like isoform X2 n=1 Tax=Amphibalanus amphitrite TaxID=1232801 RepID=UPI001C91209F|nr:UDP-sugar transporter sqv-7-like isoform X2 [Amphibalanus amphitrite]